MQITWIDGAGNVLRGEDITEATADGLRFTARSILKVTPKKHHHNTTFTCQAQNQADRTYRSARLRLLVKYAPNVTVSVVSGALDEEGEGRPGHTSRRIPEGSDVRLLCQADANPPEVRYKWFLDGDPVGSDRGDGTELVLRNVSRRHHDAIVKCQVENKVGKSEGSETLDVTCEYRIPHPTEQNRALANVLRGGEKRIHPRLGSGSACEYTGKKFCRKFTTLFL